MKRLTLLALASLACASFACGGNSTVETSGTRGTTGTGSTTGNTTGTGATTGSGTGTSGLPTDGGCAADDTLVGAANQNRCCSGYADNTGRCAEPPATTGTGSTTGTSTTSTATGTTTGGTCPSNMPDINSGTVTVFDGGSCSELGGCPQGFSCESGQCILHGANGGVQVTLSFDNDEDLDLHVIEPGGGAVWYGDTNRPTGSSNSGAVGSLDRDSNAGCNVDGVNIENVIYPSSGFPTGTYSVYVDYYEQCDSHSTVNYGVQIRANGVVWKYCGSLTAESGGGFQDPGDYCDSPTCNGSGSKMVATFTVQ